MKMPMILLSLLVLCQAKEPAPPPKEKQGLPLVYHEDFKEGKEVLEKFEPTDPAAWKITRDGKGNALSLFQQSEYKPSVRSPVNIAWIKDLKVKSFVLEVKLRSTGRDYGHRDLCLFFGGVDASHFYYVHLGQKADPHSNSIFLVNGKPRVSVATKTTKGTPWDDQHHTVRIERTESGKIEVFWDEKSIMLATDKNFLSGRLGVGSFDDTGNFASITIWGEKG